MDPNACLRRIIEAVNAQDCCELMCALEDLHRWLAKGGFMPTITITEVRDEDV